MFSRQIVKKMIQEVSSPILFSMIVDAASNSENKETDDDLLFNIETCISELRRRQQAQQPAKPKPEKKPKEDKNADHQEASQEEGR